MQGRAYLKMKEDCFRSDQNNELNKNQGLPQKIILNIVQSDHQLDKSHISDAETEDTFLGEMEHLSQGPPRVTSDF